MSATPDDSASLDECLRFAIAHRRLVGLSYHGRLRVVEPHDYGVIKGAERLNVYQLQAEDDGGASKPLRGWRLLYVQEIERCKVLEETFRGSRGAQHRRHRHWNAIYARVDRPSAEHTTSATGDTAPRDDDDGAGAGRKHHDRRGARHKRPKRP
jgi:hypothetical protein